MDTNLYWTCPNCGNHNTNCLNVRCVENDYVEETCVNCGKKFYIQFDVEIEIVNIEILDAAFQDAKDAEYKKRKNILYVKISDDGGKTWTKEEIDRSVVGLDKLPFNIGSILRITGALEPDTYDNKQLIGKIFKVEKSGIDKCGYVLTNITLL